MAQYIIAHDVGTGGDKAVLVDTEGNVHTTAFADLPVRCPCSDWAEQEPQYPSTRLR
jgi:sugar (pentulose or hexulose) kinase